MKYLMLTLTLLTGCMVGPKYHAPEMDMPSSFEEKGNVLAPIADGEIHQWWKQFNDPLLDDLLNEAVEENYDIRLALEKIEQARAQYRIERSYLWPEIDLNATASRSRISQNLLPTPPQNPSGFFPTFLNVFQIGFDAIWELDFFGKFRHAKKAAHYAWEATKEDAQNVIISMLSEVAIDYVTIRALQHKIDLLKRKIQLDIEELEITEDLFEIGIDNELQITTLISTIEEDQATLPVLETSLKQTIYALAYLLGRQPEGLSEEFQDIQPIPSGINKVPIGLPSDLLRRRHDIRSAERQLASATEQIGTAVADLFPHISLTGITLGANNRGGSSIGFESDRLHKLFTAPSRMFSVGASINWDILDFGRVRGNIAVQNSLQRQALLNYEQTVIASLKDVESALVAYFDEHRRKEAYIAKMQADLRTCQITDDLYEIGLTNALQVIETRKTLLNSESALIDSEQALISDLIALYKSLGGSWQEEDLME